MLMLIELIGALVIIGVCAYGVTKLIETWYSRNAQNKDPE
jgi:flagellar biogenesis protein FliO